MTTSGGLVGLLISVGITGCIAAVTVAGKALGKSFAIDKADDIIFNVGRLLDWPEVVRAYLKQRPKTPKE